MIKKKVIKITSLILMATMLINMMFVSAFAAPNADIPKKMLENKFLNALAYTGYDVQAQKDDGSIFVRYSTNVTKPILSNITYGTEPSGLEMVANGGTVTGKAPDIGYFERNGLCCASYISYVYYNYLPNIEGVDTSSTPCPSNPRSAPAYYEQAQSWVAAGKARWISFTQGSNGSVQTAEEVPAGSLVVYKSASNGVISHVALYAGYYNGHHFVTHVGNSRGPEISTIENSYKNGTANILMAIIVPEFVEENGAIEVYKKDTDGNDLAGAYFVATNDDTGNQYLIGPTNRNGYAITKEGIPYGAYTVRETVFPANYRSYGETEWKITVSSSNNGVATFHAVNEIIPGSVKIIKTSEDGVVSGISFTVSGNGINKTVTTNDDGSVQIDGLKPGVYTVAEKTYDKYKPQEVRQVMVVTGQVAEVPFNNVLKRGDLQVIKSAEDGLVEGVRFHLFGTSLSGSTVNEYAITNRDGVAIFHDILVSGSTPYTVEEVDTAIRYVVPGSQNAPILWNEVTSRGFTNNLKKFAVTVKKRDAEEGSAQGNASLGGAMYGIYKGETLIDQYVTDGNGQFTTREYVCDGDWTIREIVPSEGYLLDTTVYKVGGKPELYTVEHNPTSLDVVEQVAKGNIALIKHTDNGETQIETPETGATFEIYLKSSGNYEAAEEDERDVIVCDENGFGQTKNMPYGTYTVRQTSGWDGRELMDAFDVFIAQNGQTYRYIMNNRNFVSFVKVVKVDAETGNTIPYAGAGFRIYDPKGNLVTMEFTYPTPTKVDTFFTDENGSLVTPERLEHGRGYSIVEVQAPYGYVLDETPVYFNITEENMVEENGVKVIKVMKPNVAQKGTITVEKNGEVFMGVNVSGIEDMDMIYQPVYEVAGLEGAIYEIRAAEDVYTPDGTLRYSKGEVVDTITTMTNGFVTSKELYLGKYEVQEIEAPYGMVLNGAVNMIELNYAGQNVAVTENATSFYNKRQKVEIGLEKTLEVNELFGIGDNGEINNVSFGLYAAEDIVSVSGTIIPADGLVEIICLDENGTGIVKTDLPLGNYYVREIATDEHYKISDTKYPISFAYGGQDVEKVEIIVNDGNKIENDLIYGSVSGRKVDENGDALGGALIGLFCADDMEFTEDNALMTTTSAEDGSFSFANIPYGIWYIREIEPPIGFVLDETVFEVNIAEDKAVVEVEIVNEFIFGSVSGRKVDEDGNALEGALIGLFSSNDMDFTEENALMTNTSAEDGSFSFTDIPYGIWYVREIKPPVGFVLNETAYEVNIIEDEVVIEVEIADEFIVGSVSGKKVDEDGNALGGALIGLFSSDDVEFTEENALMTTISAEDGSFLFADIRYGIWYVREIEPPVGFVLNETVFEVNIAEDEVVIEVEIADDFILGSVSGKKVDEDGNALESAFIGLFSSDDMDFTEENALMTTVSAEDGSFSFTDIPYGTWYVREIEPPAGFVLDETVFEINIAEDEAVVEVEITNEHIRGNISLTKVDAEYPDNRLTGATFEVYEDTNANDEIDDEDNFMGNLEEVEEGVYEMDELLYGQYLVREVQAPDGFLLDEEVYSVFIEEDGKTYSIKNKAGIGFINEPMRGSLKIIKTSSDGKVEGFSFRVSGENGYDMTFQTDVNGEIVIEGLRVGEYTVSEVADDISAAYIMPDDKVANVMQDGVTIVEMYNEYRDTPNTGNGSNVGMWYALVGISIIGIAATLIVYKKKKNPKK